MTSALSGIFCVNIQREGKGRRQRDVEEGKKLQLYVTMRTCIIDASLRP